MKGSPMTTHENSFQPKSVKITVEKKEEYDAIISVASHVTVTNLMKGLGIGHETALIIEGLIILVSDALKGFDNEK